MADFKHGDRVRVTFEATVDGVIPNKIRIATNGEGFGDDSTFAWIGSDVTVEKIEPPVEVFGPGDRLRPTSHGIPCEITLGSDGYLQHFGRSGRVRFYEYVSSDECESFNSARYEKVYPSDG